MIVLVAHCLSYSLVVKMKTRRCLRSLRLLISVSIVSKPTLLLDLCYLLCNAFIKEWVVTVHISYFCISPSDILFSKWRRRRRISTYQPCCSLFLVGKKGNATSKDLPATAEWTKFVIHCTDKCRRFKLSREVRNWNGKNNVISSSLGVCSSSIF